MTDNSIQAIHTIAVVGGTGKEGKGLAYRWAKAGYTILIGSRQVERAQAAAAELRALLGGEGCVQGMANPDAAAAADLVVVTVPYAAHSDTMHTLKPIVQGKIVVDTTVPLAPTKKTKVQMPPAGSAGQEAREILGEGVEVISAFQNLPYEYLLNDDPIECDILVCGTSKAARAQVLDLIVKMGLVGWDAGPLENSVVPEGLTSILIGLNIKYGVKSAGIKITGIPG